MRASDVVLGLVVVALAVLLLARDGGDDEALRDLGRRMDGIEQGLAEANAQLADLRESRAQPEPPLLATPPPPPPPSTKFVPSTPAAEKARVREEIQRWIGRLQEEREDAVFTATIELARLGSMDAVAPLLQVLHDHEDFYCRLGAATALGELQAADAVSSLIDTLDDKDELVRTAAAEALRRITEQNFDFVSGLRRHDRLKIQGQWRTWWKDNEASVRSKLDQEK